MYAGSLDPISNRQDFRFIRQVIDGDTGEAIDISQASIVFEVRPKADDQHANAQGAVHAALSATTANGRITVVDAGTFQVWLPLADMQALSPGYYDVGCTIAVNGITEQLLAATLPVIDGIVSA